MTSQEIIDRFGLAQAKDTAPAELAKFKNRKTFATDPAGNLIGLNLCGCGAKDVSFLQSPDFHQLLALNLSGNPGLKSVEIPATMQRLQHLNVSENENLERLTFGAALPALETLLADQCKIASIVFPGGFAALKKVDFRKNELASVVFEAGCPALAFLDFSQNQLVELRLPKGFPGLKYFYLNDNPQLKKLEFDAPAEALEILHLRGGNLEQLPANLLKFRALKTLYLHGNPLPNIPKGASGVPEGERDNAWDNLRNYLRSIEKPEETLPNDEVKLVLLGNSTAGKSSLLRYLMTEEYDENTLGSTHGIENLLWEPGELPFKVNVWDFGGQEFYHATHRLFLSENAISLVVFEQKTNYQGETGLPIRFYKNGKVQAPKEMPVEIFPFDYWLDNINYFCKKKQRTALLQTKMDESEARKIALKTAQEEKYALVGQQQISVKAAHAGEEKFARRFRDFRDDLFAWLEDARGNYPFNRHWLEIKNDIRQLPESEKTMTWDEFARFCEARKTGISQKREGENRTELDTLTEYLHEIGVILCYRDEKELENTVFVRPTWVTETIYKVLGLEVMENNGKFDRSQVQQAAPDFDTDELLALMQKFRLVFSVNNEDKQFVAPQYLPAADPKASESFYKRLAARCKNHLFTLRFPEFLPRSVMTGFICQYGPLAKDSYWKNGICFDRGDDWLLVERTEPLEIAVRADVPDPECLHEVFATLFKLADENPDLQVSINGEDFIEARQLSGLPEHFLFSGEEKTDLLVRAKSGKHLKISEFAPILRPRHPKTSEISKTSDIPAGKPAEPKKPKVFISYAHADDSRYMKEFVKEINAHADWEIFDDRQILIGEDWHERLQKEVRECDFGIMLLSPGFAKSEYIKRHEFGEFVKRQTAEGFPFFSVLLRSCNFENWENIANRQIFDAKGEDYGLESSKRGKQIPFALLCQFSDKNELIPNEHRNDFCFNFVKAVNIALKKWKTNP